MSKALRRTVPALAALGAVAVLPAVASARVPITVAPAQPSVDGAVTISFRPAQRLKAGYSYSALVVIRGVKPTASCSGYGEASSRSRAGVVTMTIRPLQVPNAPKQNWCSGGRPLVAVTTEQVNDNPKSLGLVGMAKFQFAA